MNNLEELKQELKKLENKINELENKGNNKYNRQRYNDYYSLLHNGNISCFIDYKDEVDNFCYSIGNHFETKEQAEKYKEKLLIEQKLRDIAMELNKGEKINWDNDIRDKYYLGFAYYKDKINYYVSNKNRKQGVIYCLDKGFKDMAIERIGEERLKKYLKGNLD